MAEQKGLIKIEGTIGDLTFYKSQDGHLVKTKGGVSAERIATDPTFVRTRENGQEFANAAKAGKLLRDTFRVMMLTASDNRVTSRLTKLMTDIKNEDTTSPRGERNVGVAIATPSGLQLLQGFEFNINAMLSSIVYAQGATVDLVTGVLTIPNLTPINDIAYPSGATHVSFSAGYATVNFAGGDSEIKFTNKVNLPIDGTTSTVTLTASAVPTGSGTKIFAAEVEFFQEVNGVQYSLKNGAYNALAIVEAA